MERNQFLGLFLIVPICIFSPSNLFGMKKFSNNFFKNKSQLLKQKANAPFLNMWSNNQQKRSIFHYTEYAGLEDVFICEKLKEKASPLRGITFIESDVLKNLYVYFPEDHPVMPLLKDKKYGLFHVLQNSHNPLLHDLRHTQINPGCALTPELTAHIVAEAVRGTLELPEVKKEIAIAWKESYGKQRPGNRISNKTLENQCNVIIQAQQENILDKQERIFPEDFGISLLLAHLYCKGTKLDMVHYVKALAKHFPEKIDKKALECSMQKHYSGQELKQHLYFLRQGKYDLFLKNHSKAIASIKQHQEGTSAYPPRALQGSYGYKSGKTRPDCCETGIRNLCNVLLVRNGILDLSVLPSHIKPYKNFMEFYTLFSEYNTINSSAAGQAWMNLVSGHNRVQYDQGDYELYSSVKNILAVMNILLQTEAKDFKELGSLLSTKERAISFTVSQGTIQLKIEQSDADFLKMELQISPGCHTVTKFYDQPKDVLLNKWQQYDFKVKLSKSPSLLNGVPFFAKKMDTFFDSVSNGLPWRVMETYGREFSDVNERVEGIRELCGTYAMGKKVLKDPIIALCKTIPQNDFFLMNRVFRHLLNTDLFECEQWFMDLALANPISCAHSIIDRMILERSCIADFHWKLLKRILSDVQCDKRYIMEMLLDNDLLQHEQFFLEWAKMSPQKLVTGIITTKMDVINPSRDMFYQKLFDETLYAYLESNKHLPLNSRDIFKWNDIYTVAQAGGKLYESVYLFHDKKVGQFVVDVCDMLGYLDTFFYNNQKGAQPILEKLCTYFSEHEQYHMFLEVIFYKLLYYHRYILTDHYWSKNIIMKHQDLYQKVLWELKKQSHKNEIVAQAEQSYKIFLEDNKFS